MRSDRVHASFKTDSHIEVRSFEYGVAMLGMVQHYKEDIPEPLANRLVTIGTEIGYNVAEAHIGKNKKRFHRIMNDARRQSREIGYWLRLLEASDCIPTDTAKKFLQEAEGIHKEISKACDAAKADLARAAAADEKKK